jgi:predicted DNA-binding transcriptional regulator AlpA
MANDITDGKDPLFVTPEAARYIKMSAPSLERWRGQGLGPDFCKMGGSVRYRKSALDQYIEECTRSAAQMRRAKRNAEAAEAAGSNLETF